VRGNATRTPDVSRWLGVRGTALNVGGTLCRRGGKGSSKQRKSGSQGDLRRYRAILSLFRCRRHRMADDEHKRNSADLAQASRLIGSPMAECSSVISTVKRNSEELSTSELQWAGLWSQGRSTFGHDGPALVIVYRCPPAITEDDPHASMKLSKFLRRAWWAANERARVGWINKKSRLRSGGFRAYCLPGLIVFKRTGSGRLNFADVGYENKRAVCSVAEWLP
jgi:hypothetical protein